MKTQFFLFVLAMTILAVGCTVEESQEKKQAALPSQLYQYTDQLAPGWSSFENITAEKGKGGMENFGAKGHP